MSRFGRIVSRIASVFIAVVLSGCMSNSTNSGSNSTPSLANPTNTYWQSAPLATSLYQLALVLNNNGSGQCTYKSSGSNWYPPTNITWQLSNSNLALANAGACLAPLITGVQITGNPPLAFTGTLNDSGATYAVTFSQQSGTLP